MWEKIKQYIPRISMGDTFPRISFGAKKERCSEMEFAITEAERVENEMFTTDSRNNCVRIRVWTPDPNGVDLLWPSRDLINAVDKIAYHVRNRIPYIVSNTR